MCLLKIIVQENHSVFPETLDATQKTAVRRFGSAKTKHKEIKKAMCCGHNLQSAVVIQK